MKKEKFSQRKIRIRSKISGTSDRPRLTVFRSNKKIYGQIIDDSSRKTIVSAESGNINEPGVKGKVAKATIVGEEIAKKALSKKIKKVVFDRGGYKYHGRVKALAEGARKGGLEF